MQFSRKLLLIVKQQWCLKPDTRFLEFLDIVNVKLENQPDIDALEHWEIVMRHLNATVFAGASNMSPDQIQQLFSPIVPGTYANRVVFSPSTNPQDAIFRAIEALRQLKPSEEENPTTTPPVDTPLAHG